MSFIIEGKDFMTGNSTFLLSRSDIEWCYNISIINDQALEDNEAFMVILSSSDSDFRLLNNISVVSIEDDGDSKSFALYSLREK